MGQVFARRKGQRVQIGEALVVVKRIDRRRVELYVDAPSAMHVKGLDARPEPEDQSATAPLRPRADAATPAGVAPQAGVAKKPDRRLTKPLKRLHIVRKTKTGEAEVRAAG
jgi:hypothetical protein